MLHNKVIIDLFTYFKENSVQSYLVGGCVRDSILNPYISPKDYDIECYGVDFYELRDLLFSFSNDNNLKLITAGESYKVYKLINEEIEIDISIPRTDVVIDGNNHRSFLVEGNPNSSFEDACKRRDFTINAILLNPLTNELIDPFGGIFDLNKKLIKHVDSEHFSEDPLRVLRAAQFASRLGFDIDQDTVDLCRKIDVSSLSKERIWMEVEKIILKSPTPWKGFKKLRELGVCNQLFPQIYPLFSLNNGHFEVMDNLVNYQCDYYKISDYDKLVLVMASILAYLPEKDGLDFLYSVGANTKGTVFFNEIINLAKDFDIAWEFKLSSDNNSTLMGDFRRMSARINPFHAAIAGDCIDLENVISDWFINKCKEYNTLYGPPEPLLNGNVLIEYGIEPGPFMGHLLKSIYDLQLNGFVNDVEQALQIVEITLTKKNVDEK